MSVPVTFTSKAKRASAIIPVFQDKIVEDTETFDVTIDIPSSLKHRISPGRQRKAVATIIDSTSKFSIRVFWIVNSLYLIHSSYQLSS